MMTNNLYYYVVVVTSLFAFSGGGNAADILAIIPTASFSHQVPFRPLWKELSKRGHNITLVTTDPMKDPSLKNIKQIDISYAYKYFEEHRIVDIAINDSSSFYEIAVAIRKATNASNNAFFQSSEGQNLIHNKDNHFDLLFVEAQLPAMMIFSWKYQIPFIGISSLDCSIQYHETAGNLIHPIVTPDPNFPIENIKQLTFWERLVSLFYMNIFRGVIYFLTFPREQKMLKQYFGNEIPAISEIQNNMSMLFIATNPLFHSVRALMPNTITIGNGMHVSESQPLTQDIQKFLDEAKLGAIYFSLGSNIKSKHLNETTKNELLKALSSLPYRVLWKLDHKFDKLPENILVSRWFGSQQSILMHRNVKAFITQGGLQSMQESIYANKPMIGIPFFGDQHRNVKRMVELEYGIHINKHNITKESVRGAVLEIINNPKYTEKAREMGEIFRDVDISNVDKAVWWTEYVIRHNGARHFRNPLLDMPFWKIYMLDIFAVIFVVILTLVKIIGLIFQTLKWLYYWSRKAKVNINKKKK